MCSSRNFVSTCTSFPSYHCTPPQESLHSLSSELMVVVEASLLIRLWMEGHKAEVKVNRRGVAGNSCLGIDDSDCPHCFHTEWGLEGQVIP